MSRALKVLDSNLPSTSSNSPHNSSNFSKEAIAAQAPKNKLREWTFPRSNNNSISKSTSSNPSTSGTITANVPSSIIQTITNSPKSGNNNSCLADTNHGRTTSTSVRTTTIPVTEHSSPQGRFTAPNASSQDIRHRPNASMAYPQLSRAPNLNPSLNSAAGGTVTSTTTTNIKKPGDVIKMIYSNVRRRSITDILYLFVFGATLLLFASALLGYGATTLPTSFANLESRATDSVQVEIPAGFQPEKGFIPADVHQPLGDNSHDSGEDLFKASPQDAALDDENVHHVIGHQGEDALFHRPSSENEPDAHEFASADNHKHESSVNEPEQEVEAAPIRAEIDGTNVAPVSDSELEQEELAEALKAEELEAYELDAEAHQHEQGHAAAHDHGMNENNDDPDDVVVSPEEEVEIELEFERLQAEEREKLLAGRLDALRKAQQDGEPQLKLKVRPAGDVKQFAAIKPSREEVGRRVRGAEAAGFKKQRLAQRRK